MESQLITELNKKVFDKVSEIILGPRDNKDIAKLIDSLIGNYSDFILQEFDDSIFKDLKTSKAKVKRNIEYSKCVIIKSIRSFLKGNVFDAVNEIERIFKFFDEKTITTDYTLYRGRVSNNNYLFNREEMFHIPLNKRNLVKNQRFSLSGFPCLYLGATTLSCWEELERPDYGLTNFVSLKSTREFNVLDLSYPDTIKSLKDIVKISIIIACSLKAKKEDEFKSEYILPQLILHRFIKQRNCNKSNCDGIAYHSISLYNVKERIFQFQENGPSLELNRYISYVMPVSDVENFVTIGKNQYCTQLVNLFNISESISSNIRGFKKSLTNNIIPSSLDKYQSLYQNSCFADIDCYLEKASMSKLGEDCFSESSYDSIIGGWYISMQESGFSGELPITPKS